MIPFSGEFNIIDKEKDFSIIMLYDSQLGYIKNADSFIEENKRVYYDWKNWWIK